MNVWKRFKEWLMKVFREKTEPKPEEEEMAFFNSGVELMATIVTDIGTGLGVWGVINLLEGYGNDNPAAKSQGMKHLFG